MAATRLTVIASRADAWNIGTSRFRASCQTLMPATKAPAVTNAPKITCGKVTRVVGLVSTAQMSVSSARPVTGLRE